MSDLRSLRVSDELVDELKGKWIPVEGFKIEVDEHGILDIQFTQDIALQQLLANS